MGVDRCMPCRGDGEDVLGFCFPSYFLPSFTWASYVMSLIISSFLFTGLLCMLNIYHHHHTISNFVWFAKFLRVTWKDFPLYLLGLRSFIATVVLHSCVNSRVFSFRSYVPAFRRDFQPDRVCAELRNEGRHTTLYASRNSESQAHSTGRKSLCPWRAVGYNPCFLTSILPSRLCKHFADVRLLSSNITQHALPYVPFIITV